MTGRGGFAGFEGLDDPDDLRVGDAERDEVAVSLHDHFAQGRLSREELDERLDATLGAKTAGDLREVTRDLPGPRAGSARRDGAAGGRTGDGPHGGWHPGALHDALHDAGWRHGGPPWRGHRHAHRFRFAPLLIGLFLVTAIMSGLGWAFAILVKAVLFGWLIFAVAGLLSHRRGHRVHRHRGPHALR
jgi:hypothetical protein